MKEIGFFDGEGNEFADSGWSGGVGFFAVGMVGFGDGNLDGVADDVHVLSPGKGIKSERNLNMLLSSN